MVFPPGGPPPHIPLPGAGGPPPGLGGPPPGPSAGGIPGRADTPQISALLDRAAEIIQQCVGMEKDAIDKAEMSDLVARIHKIAGNQQKLVDSATGAGPGARLVRKTAPAPGY